MTKVAFRAATYLVLSIVASQWIGSYVLSAALLNALFTTSGIMFAIGLGLIVNFSPEGVDNLSYIRQIRNTINVVKKNFLLEFILVAITYVLSIFPFFSIVHKVWVIDINFSLYFGIQIFASIFYFAYNFMEIQKLKDEIFDRLREERLRLKRKQV